jgi:hypothetical protein
LIGHFALGQQSAFDAAFSTRSGEPGVGLLPQRFPAVEAVAVRLVLTTVEASSAAERRPRTGTRAAWLIAGCYLLGALAVTVHLWADPAGLVQMG